MSNFIFFVTCLLSIAVSLCSSTTTLAQGIPRPPYPPKELAGVTLFLLDDDYTRDSILVYCQDSLVFNGIVETLYTQTWTKAIPLPHISLNDTSVHVKVVHYRRKNFLTIIDPENEILYTAYSLDARYKDPITSEIRFNIPKQGRYIIYDDGGIDETKTLHIRKGIPYYK